MSRQERDSSGRIITQPENPAMRPESSTTETVHRETVAGPVTWEEMRALLRREPVVTERTWRPTVGGLLSILAGSWNFLLGLGALVGGTALADLIPSVSGITGGVSTATYATTTAGAVLIVLGLISIIGGAYALARRAWPMVLAGSIAALVPTPIVLPFIMGFFALIFNVLGHKEFWGPREFQKDYQSNIQHSIEKNR